MALTIEEKQLFRLAWVAGLLNDLADPADGIQYAVFLTIQDGFSALSDDEARSRLADAKAELLRRATVEAEAMAQAVNQPQAQVAAIDALTVQPFATPSPTPSPTQSQTGN